MKKDSQTNEFNGGLVMDLNPILTPKNVLTDCLNGTIITNNGNENVLQNDMGNARVETAFLPEGYIPVGSCEFGDIIYIASYNPLINKCQLGCFPSPQRNIVSSNINNPQQSLTNTEFQKYYTEGDNIGKPTGEIINSTLKKVLYSTNLTSGDKYIICAKNITKQKHLSDLGNTDHEIGRFPKLYKIRVVSIEDDGKITDLSNGLKWYNNNYFINGNDITNAEESIDTDIWRSAVNSAYAIFTSKVSGKLALLIELESITGFSCTWGIKDQTKEKVNTKEEEVNMEEVDNITYDTYKIYNSINWETEDNNINPSNVKLEGNLEFEGNWKNETQSTQRIEIENSTLTYPPSEQFFDIQRSYNQENIGDYSDFKSNCYQQKLSTFLNEKGLKEDDKLVWDRYDEEYNKYYKLSDVKGANWNSTNKKYLDKNGKVIISFEVKDDIINNTFKLPVRLSLGTFKIPKTQKQSNDKFTADIQKCKYKYKLTPCMPYGLLPAYAQENTIDFLKIDTDSVKLNTWKYFNQEGYSTLTWGMEAYTEPNHVISKVVFEFYGIEGLCGSLIYDNNDSYNGIFTKYLQFENGALNTVDREGSTIYIKYKIGDVISRGSTYYTKSDGKYTSKIAEDAIVVSNKENCYKKSSGELRVNTLYYVKISVEDSEIGPCGDIVNPQFKHTFYRWMWTTKQFNDLYFQTSDFNRAQFKLTLDGDVTFAAKSNFNITTTPGVLKLTNDDVVDDVQKIEDANPNVTATITEKLEKDWGIFQLVDNSTNKTVYLNNNQEIEYTPEQPELTSSARSSLNTLDQNVRNQLIDMSSNQINFALDNPDTNQEFIKFVDYKGDYKEENLTRKSNVANSFDIKVTAEQHNKYTYKVGEVSRDVPVLKSLITENGDYSKYNISKFPIQEDSGNTTYRYCFNKLMLISVLDKERPAAKGVISVVDINPQWTNNQGENSNNLLSGTITTATYKSIYQKSDQNYNINDIFNYGADSEESKGEGKEVLIKHFHNFLFPYTFSQISGDWTDGNQSGRYNNDEHQVISEGLQYGGADPLKPGTIGGSIGYISANEEIVFSDPKQENRLYKNLDESLKKDDKCLANWDSIVYYAEPIAKFLENCFYLSNSNRQQNISVILEWIYFKQYTIEKTADIIIDFKPSIISNEKNYLGNITIEGTNGYDFVNTIYKYVNPNENITLDDSNANVNLKIEDKRKTFPLTIKIISTIPSMTNQSNASYSVNTLCNSDKVEEAVKNYNGIFQRGVLYFFNEQNNIIELSGSTIIQEKIENRAKVIPDSSGFLTDLDKSKKNVKFDQQFIDRLEVVDDMLQVNSYISGLGGTYFVQPHTKRRLTGFKSGVEIMKFIDA